MEQNNTLCVICGKGYHLCITCKEKMRAEPWKLHTDTAEHYKIYAIITGYINKIYSKDEAKNKLDNVDLSDKHTFNTNVIKVINEILDADNSDKDVKPDIKDETERKKRSKKTASI